MIRHHKHLDKTAHICHHSVESGIQAHNADFDVPGVTAEIPCPEQTSVKVYKQQRVKNPVRQINAFDAGLIALGAALNVSIGYLVSLLKLPIYLDSIGTVFVAALCGWQYGVIAGIAALIVLTITAIPTVIAYAGTAVVIAMLSAFLTRFGFLKTLKGTIIGGIIIGLASAAASTPVTTLVFGGVSFAGTDAITALFKASGFSLWKSVILGKLLIDPVDKLVTALICFSLVQSLPPRMLERLKK